MEHTDYVYIDFVMEDYTNHPEPTDACCKISTELGNQGLLYGIDFWFHECYEELDGTLVLKFGFTEKHEAMIIKLAGIEVIGTRH